jgi:S-adenosylmethionine hydrolase
MRNPLITLTTDFGAADHYVGTMKGVILGIAPRARIVDISHEVQPFTVTDGAYVICQAYRYFPPRSIHVVVVDPGVGSARRPILAEAGGQRFIAPDNGVLSMVFDRESNREKVRHITAERYFLKPLSRTFHGRDVFAPVAAHLAAGIAPARFGKMIADYLRLDFFRPVRTGKRVWTGTVLRVDRFGNLITSFRLDDFPDVAARTFDLQIGLERLSRLAASFSEGETGEALVIPGSGGYLEVAFNRDSAARRLGCGPGAPVELTLH